MAEILKAVKGMNDILPPESARWEWFEEKVRALMGRYGFQNVRTPIVEPTPLFVRGLGEVTDIVEKEMYSFTDKLNGDLLTLRPEGTAGVVRATVEHNMLYDGPKRLWYVGPMFRHERPQKGRYRQFHQIGVEALGFAGAEVDAEVILMLAAFWRDLGLTDVRLELNSLGQPEERKAHRDALIAYLETHQSVLDEDAKRRMYANPLRVLDTKNPAMQDVVNAAPKLLDFLGEASKAHFEQVKALLEANGVAYRINPRLVRGMDYYNLTVFEWVTDRLGSQGTVCGGGRYDTLVEQLGGKPAPAVGWGMGIERVLALLEESQVAVPVRAPDAYLVVPEAAAFVKASVLAEQLRAMGIHVQMHGSGKDGLGSMKSQFKKADASGARFALIFGGDELARGEVSVKPLRNAELQQQSVPLVDAEAVAKLLRA